MKKKTASQMLLMLLLMSMVTLAFNIPQLMEPPPTEWTRTYGGTGYDGAYSAIQTSDGGYAISGFTESLGAGLADFWLVKTDSAGNMQWNQTYGGTGEDYGGSVVETSDGGYAIVGDTYSFGAGLWDFWLVKTDSAGTIQWNRTYGGTKDEYGAFMVQTSDGGYAIAGDTYSFGAGGADFWLIKTDSAGTMQWNQTYGGTDDDGVWSVVQTSDGGYAIAGETHSFGAGVDDCWLVKTDSAGHMEWNQTYGGTSGDYGRSVVQTFDGGYAIAGGTHSFGVGYSDFWLVKTDSAGHMEWNQTYGGTSGDYVTSMVQTSDGGYAIAGYTASFGAGDHDFWSVKTDLDGNMQWNQTYGGTDGDSAYSVVQTLDGGYAIAGYTESFGAGLWDIWLVKLGPKLPYDVTVDAYCYTEDAYVSVSITMDGTPTGYTTPHTFMGLTDTHTFTVPNTDASGHPFQHWSTGPTSTTVTVDSAGTYTAYYRAKYTLTITTTTGGTTSPEPGAHTYWSGTSASVTAISYVDYTFDHWELDSVNVGSTNPISVTMNQDHSLHAVFVYLPSVPEFPGADISTVAATFTFFVALYLILKGKKQNHTTTGVTSSSKT